MMLVNFYCIYKSGRRKTQVSDIVQRRKILICEGA